MTSPLHRLPEFLAIILAFVAGLLAFGNYFFDLPFLVAPTQFLLKTVVLVSGAALLMAAFNLAGRHARRAAQKDVGSALLIGGFIAAFVAGLLPGGFSSGLGGWLYQWLLAPGLAALFALLPIFLAYALFRHLSVRDLGGFLLFVGMIIVLLGQMPALASRFPILAAFRHDLLIGPAAAAFRGVILGLATGVILAIFLKLFPGSGPNFLSSQSKDEDQS
jgi:hypothetical protein